MTLARPHHVVVCGGGMSGLTAAATALEKGAAVTILEKGHAVGGSAVLSSGHIWTHASVETAAELIPDGNAAIQERIISTVQDGRDWLRGLGVRMTDPATVHTYGIGQLADPSEIIGNLATRIRQLGGEIRLETALNALITTPEGRIVAVEVTLSTGELELISADAVVLATGGFQGNPELRARYIREAGPLYLRGNPWSTGDGFLAAQQIGAMASAGLDRFYGHAMLAPPARFRPIEFRDASQYYGTQAVALNVRGLRFTDESVGSGEEVLNQALARQPQGRGFYVLDSAIATREARQAGPVTRSILERAKTLGGTVLVAESLPDLCERLGEHGVHAGTALSTLETYNAACQRSVRAAFDLDPPRSRFAQPILVPPLYAVAVQASITFTTGGLAVDEQMRVLRRTGSSSPVAQLITDVREYRECPFPNLYAAGCDVGNVHNVSYMGGLATALTTGRIAGSNASGA